jgi:hypothetical protein
MEYQGPDGMCKIMSRCNRKGFTCRNCTLTYTPGGPGVTLLPSNNEFYWVNIYTLDPVIASTRDSYTFLPSLYRIKVYKFGQTYFLTSQQDLPTNGTFQLYFRI